RAPPRPRPKPHPKRPTSSRVAACPPPPSQRAADRALEIDLALPKSRQRVEVGELRGDQIVLHDDELEEVDLPRAVRGLDEAEGLVDAAQDVLLEDRERAAGRLVALQRLHDLLRDPLADGVDLEARPRLQSRQRDELALLAVEERQWDSEAGARDPVRLDVLLAVEGFDRRVRHGERAREGLLGVDAIARAARRHEVRAHLERTADSFLDREPPRRAGEITAEFQGSRAVETQEAAQRRLRRFQLRIRIERRLASLSVPDGREVRLDHGRLARSRTSGGRISPSPVELLEVYQVLDPTRADEHGEERLLHLRIEQPLAIVDLSLGAGEILLRLGNTRSPLPRDLDLLGQRDAIVSGGCGTTWAAPRAMTSLAAELRVELTPIARPHHPAPPHLQPPGPPP